jgi:hypothetical protein
LEPVPDPDEGRDALTLVKMRAARCSSALLHRPIVHYEASVVCDFVDAITTPSQWPVWMDVPVSAVVGLHHINFTAKDVSWGEALNGLTARNWDARVFDYWSGDIRDQGFPATGARRALRLKCLAGAVFSENGVHRLTAGVAWLCATHGDAAQLRMVRTRVADQRGDVVDAVVDLARESRLLEVACRYDSARFHSEAATYAVRATSHRGRTTIFDVSLPLGQLEQRRGRRFPWLVRDTEQKEDWQRLPQPLLDAWTARGWLAASRARAERCPTDVD